MPDTIALCVVARNEAALIGACIESASPVVDDVIVVDTGSCDGTAETARRAGARVFEVPWPGDLAQAHDLPLAHARADWVLGLDGDELLDPGARGLVPALVRDTRVDGFRLPIRNYSYSPELKMRVADTGDPLTAGALCYYPTAVVRLHRRRDAVHHRGRLHQNLRPSIVEAGGRVKDAPVPIHHYGLLRTDREKTPLYRILARQQVADTPSSGRAWFDLGMTFHGPRLPGGLDAFRRASALGLGPSAAFMIGRILLEGDRPRAATRWMNRAIEGNVGDASYDFDNADAWELLAAAFENLGQRRSAERAWRRALTVRPDSPAAANNLAGLLIERGELDVAERLLLEVTQRFPGITTVWATLGVLRLHQGRPVDAQRAFEIAVDIDPANRPALSNLALACRARGLRAASARAARAAREPIFGSDEPGIVARRSRARTPRPLAPGGVLSLIPALHGGGGRVLVDAVRALRGYPQVVVCGDSGAFTGEAFADELRAEGVEIRTVANGIEAVRAIAQLRPACVVDHCWQHYFPEGPVRAGRERWIAVGHSNFPMPFGYDAYVVLSAFHAQYQEHLPPGHVHRIPNGVDLGRYRPRRARAGGPITIAAVTRLDPAKLPRQLFAYLPDLRALGARLLIAGRGPRRYELEPEIRARGLEDVIQFVGAIPSSDVAAFLAQADIGLHVTEMHLETCCMGVIEMMASGLPVVGQPKGCLPEMVAHGESGYLAAMPQEIAARLMELIASPELRRRLGAAGRRAARPYRMSLYASRMRALVDRTIHERRVPPWPGPPSGPEQTSARSWRPSTSYLVCTTERTGGWFLHEVLSDTGVCGFPIELRIPGDGPGPEEDEGRAAFERWLGRFLEQGSTPNGVFGAKVFPPDLERFVGHLRARAGCASLSAYELLEGALPGLRLVRLSRRDRLRQAISLARARQTMWWTYKAGDRERPPRPRLGEARIRQALADIDDAEARLDGWLASWPERVLDITYEDLTADPRRIVTALLRHLDLAAPSRPHLASAAVMRQADEETERWVKRLRRSSPTRSGSAARP